MLRTPVVLALLSIAACTPAPPRATTPAPGGDAQLPAYVYLSVLDQVRSGYPFPTGVHPASLPAELDSAFFARRGVVLTHDACKMDFYMQVDTPRVEAPSVYTLTVTAGLRSRFHSPRPFRVDCRGGLCSAVELPRGEIDMLLACGSRG